MKNIKEYQTSHALSQQGHSYIPKTNHHYRIFDRMRGFFLGSKMRGLLELHLTYDEIARRKKHLKQYGNTGGFFRWVNEKGVRFGYRGFGTFALGSSIFYFAQV